MTLLEKAKLIKVKNRAGDIKYNEEELDLALAYIKGEVTGKQVISALDKKHGNVGGLFMPVLYRAIKAAKLVKV